MITHSFELSMNQDFSTGSLLVCLRSSQLVYCDNVNYQEPFSAHDVSQQSFVEFYPV